MDPPVLVRRSPKHLGCSDCVQSANLVRLRVGNAIGREYGGDVFVLVVATLAGGILTCVCAWPWFGLGALLLASFGAGSAAVFAGLLLAALRSQRPAATHKPVPGTQPEAPTAIANDTLSAHRRRA
jgi:hypothetical protein